MQDNREAKLPVSRWLSGVIWDECGRAHVEEDALTSNRALNAPFFYDDPLKLALTRRPAVEWG